MGSDREYECGHSPNFRFRTPGLYFGVEYDFLFD